MLNLGLVIRKYPECMQSKEKLSALLNDLYPDQRRIIYILVLSYDCGIVDELKSAKELDEVALLRFTQRMVLRYGVQEELVHEALALWCDALGVVRDATNSAISSQLKKLEVGSIINATVKAVLESILIMDIGISGERAVLPKAYCFKDSIANIKEGDQITTRVKSFYAETSHPYWILSAKIPKVFQVGDRVVGTVSNVSKFGAFVDLDGCQEGLIHISDLAWEKVKTVTDYVNCGDQIEVLITKITPEGRISLSRRFPEYDPWNRIKSYSKDDVLIGKITMALQFGFIVDLSDGVEGLVHISECPRNMQFTEGQTVQVKIKEIDDEKRRVSLCLVL